METAAATGYVGPERDHYQPHLHPPPPTSLRVDALCQARFSGSAHRSPSHRLPSSSRPQLVLVLDHIHTLLDPSSTSDTCKMQPNWQQQQYGGYGQNNYGSNPSFMTSQPTGFPGGGGGYGQQPQQQQQTGFQPQQTGFQPQQTGFQPQQTGFPSQQTGFGQPPQGQRPGGNLSFLNQPPPSMSSYRTGGGMAPQPTGFVAGGASGLMSQQTGYQPSLMSQPTGFGGGLMSQPTGMGGLRAQPTGFQDPRLQSMMQSFMPSNMSQVSYRDSPRLGLS